MCQITWGHVRATVRRHILTWCILRTKGKFAIKWKQRQQKCVNSQLIKTTSISAIFDSNHTTLTVQTWFHTFNLQHPSLVIAYHKWRSIWRSFKQRAVLFKQFNLSLTVSIFICGQALSRCSLEELDPAISATRKQTNDWCACDIGSLCITFNSLLHTKVP